MIVCVCKAVTRRQLNAIIADGADSLEAVARRCGAGTDCGACRDSVVACLDSTHPPSPPREPK